MELEKAPVYPASRLEVKKFIQSVQLRENKIDVREALRLRGVSVLDVIVGQAKEKHGEAGERIQEQWPRIRKFITRKN